MTKLNSFQSFALNDDGCLVNIKDADTSNGQHYYCPNCQNEMITKRGKKRQWHFAHKVEKCSYDKYLHSIAEIMIMDWFNRKQHIMLHMKNYNKCSNYVNCSFYNDIDCKSEITASYDLKSFYPRCVKEHKYRNFIADLYCSYKGSSDLPIFIEIYVTHKCSPEKIKSGIRIIEISIQSEEDIFSIIKSSSLIEGDHVQLYNFKRKDNLLNTFPPLSLHKYILYNSFKSFVDFKRFNCKNYDRIRKGIFEISIPDNFLSYACKNNDFYLTGKVRAYLEGLIKKDCHLCKHKSNSSYDTCICTLHKESQIPCLYTDASKCSDFKENTIEIYEINEFLNTLIDNGLVDIWKSDIITSS